MELIRKDLNLLCHPIEEDSQVGLENFMVREDGGYLAGYLKERAISDSKNHFAKTYIVRDMGTDEIVAYFSLKAGFVATDIKYRIRHSFDALPGIEISNLAVNEEYIKAHPLSKGIGSNIFREMIMPIAKEVQKYIGVHFIYIFALPHKTLIQKYESWNFSRLSSLQQENLMHKRIRPRYDQGCIFMYQIL